MSPHSPHLAALLDYMGVARWIVPDVAARVRLADPPFMRTERGMNVLRETIG